MNKITYKTALEIAYHEALVRLAYRDRVNVWTWSVGITSASGHNVERYIGKPQTIERCLEVYVWLLENHYAPAVRRAFKGHELTENEFAAALSFHWNTGAIEYASWVRHFKAGRISAARAAFMNWTTPKSITARRKAERDLFFSGKWSAKGKIKIIPVTKSNRPYWRKAKWVNVERELKSALGMGQEIKILPQAPAMPPPDVPQAMKDGGKTEQPAKGGLLQVIIDFVLKLFFTKG